MDKKYELFNFFDIIEGLKEKHNGEETFEKFIEDFDENSTIEDMPFYKHYVSKFDVERAFEGFNLSATEMEILSKDDLFLLFRLILASFSSSYDILYDKQSHSIDLSISVTHGERSVTKTVSELWSFQIIRLFEIYVNEQIDLGFIEDDYQEEAEQLKEERKKRLMVFEKKMQQVHNQQESDRILEDLDELLNS